MNLERFRERVLQRIGVFAGKRPEEDESWESWYPAAFDMLFAEVTALAPAEQPTHRHLNSGHLVREIGRGFAQVSAHPIKEMTAVSIYEHGGQLWVRNAVEFDDGRFADLPAPALQEVGK